MDGSLEVSGVKIYYKLCSDCNEYDGTITWTEFFTKEGTKPEKKWSWRKFRMIPTGVLLPNYEIILSLNFLISKNYNISREELLKKVEDSYKNYIKKQKRKEELNKGIVI